MAGDFSKSTREGERAWNADDPTADRAAAYPEAGELGSRQDTHSVASSATGPSTAPSGPEAATSDEEYLDAAPLGNRLGGWQGRSTEEDPGLPGHDQPAEGGRDEAEDSGAWNGQESAFADRRDRARSELEDQTKA